MAPRLSVVVLTWNEARNIGPCLRSLARQRVKDFEVIVVDAASTDGTVPAAEAERPTLGVPLRLVVADRRIPIGEARNRGAGLAGAPIVAFLSADAELDERWTEEALRTLDGGADLAFGRQVHDPHEWTAGACVRGLRYHFPAHVPDDPLPYASNVAAAYRREVLQRFPFDPWANAAEDLLLARRAQRAGFKVAYDPWMVVHHHDVATVRQEWRKSVREGYGWAEYAREIGHLRSLPVWAALLLLGAAAAAWRPLLGVPLLLGALYLPALRRAARRLGSMPARAIALGVLASPPFDLAFLAQYARGAIGRRKGVPAKASTAAASPSPELESQA